MDFFVHPFIGVLAFLPSTLLLFGINLIWEQSKLLNRQLYGIAQMLKAPHHEQKRGNATNRFLDTNFSETNQ